MFMRRKLSFIPLLVLVIGAVHVQGQRWMDDPGQRGHYAIGHTSYLLTDTARKNRPVYLDVWYPADSNAIPSSTPAVYFLDPYSPNPSVSTSTDWETLGYDSAYEKPQPSGNGPFPLLVFSPGWGSDSWNYLFIGTRLASHGYIVAVLDHYGDCCDDLATAQLNRPRDVSFSITKLLAMTAGPRNLLGGAINSKAVAVGGHSLGGYAAYALTGGDPKIRDLRLRTMIALDGSSQLLHYSELAKISTPSLIMGENVENSGEFGPEFRDWIARPHAAIHRSDSFRVDVNGANHISFTNNCDGAQVFFNLGLISPEDLAIWQNEWPCASSGWNPVTISSFDEHQVITKYMIAFLDVYLAPFDLDWPLDRWILTENYALDHTPQVQFFASENCEATLPDSTYFRYRPHQVPSECETAPKDPAEFFGSQVSNSASGVPPRKPGVKVWRGQPAKPF